MWGYGWSCSRLLMESRETLQCLTFPAGQTGDGGQGMVFPNLWFCPGGDCATHGQLAVSGYVFGCYHWGGRRSWLRAWGGQGCCSAFLRARDSCVWPHASVVRRWASAVLDENLLWEQPGTLPVSPWLFFPGASHPDSTVGPAGHPLFTISMGPPTPASPARVLSVRPGPLFTPEPHRVSPRLKQCNVNELH